MSSLPPGEAQRLFVAVPLPELAMAALGRLVDAVRGAGAAGVRAADPTTAHLTLKFLGDVDARRTAALAAALEGAAGGAAPFTLALGGVGGFPDLRAPHTLWAGVAEGAGPLGALARAVDEACAGLGFARERRPFAPHVTVARLRSASTPVDRRRAADALTAAAGVLDGSAFDVDDFALVRSVLTPAGPVYTTLHRVALSTPSPSA